MKKMLVLLVVFSSVLAGAKTLTVNCAAKNGKSIDLVSEIANVNTPQKIKSLIVNGNEVSNVRDISQMPIYQNGDLAIQIQFGTKLYSSSSLVLTKCNDDFEATGKAAVKEYVGGFAGTAQTNMTCSCSLK